jgi:hypothetical protein
VEYTRYFVKEDKSKEKRRETMLFFGEEAILETANTISQTLQARA